MPPAEGKVKVLVSVVIAVGLLLVVLRFGFPVAHRMWTGRALAPPNAAQLQDTEKLMELKLPPSARPVAWNHSSWLDYRIFLKVEIDPSDLQALIQNSPFAAMPLNSKEHNFYDGVGGGWWDDGGQAQRFLFGETLLPQGQQYQDRRLQILVDMDRKDVYLLYLALFST